MDSEQPSEKAAPSGRKIRVLIVDDHPVVRVGLRALISAEPDIDVVGDAGDGHAALAAYAAFNPDVVLLDLRLPGLSGLQVLQAIRKANPMANVVVVTACDMDDADVYQAIRAGAGAVLFKGAFPEGILATAVRKIHAGGQAFSAEVTSQTAASAKLPRLNRREVQILELCAKGLSNKEAGAALSISEMTVKYHLKHAYARLGAADRTEAVVLARRLALIKLP